MADASPPLEREALLKKDRDELLTIAEALGGKPASRAKKADIADLILDLAGVTSAPASDDSADADDGEGDDDSGSADESAAAGSGGDRAPKPAAKPQNNKPQNNKPKNDNGGRGGDSRGGKQQGNQPKQGQQPSRQQQQRPPQQDKGQQNGSPDGGDDNDPNSKRRRRGRNRDAPEEYTGDPIPVVGILDVQREGFGFLRTNGPLQSKEDAYVSVKQVRQFGLRAGDKVSGGSRPAFRNEKNPALLSVDQVNDADPALAKDRPDFDSLTPLFPDEKLVLEQTKNPNAVTSRIIDLIAPIGKGQRGMIVSPPKAGKTSILKEIARSIEKNSPDVELLILLVDERPEEVTDMARSIESAEVISSTFDRPTDEHCKVAELTLERAKRLVESGRDVVILLDGITRLVRAYNMSGNLTGRSMSGGLDTGAIYPPKKFFGAARNLEEAGSLTIIATALVETGSRMDEVIFEEFKGTGNMELKLDRRLAERRVFPAIDIDASSTRHEELLFSRKDLDLVWKLRRVLQVMADGDEGRAPGAAGLELLIDRMGSFKTNDAFLAEIAKN